MDLGFSNIKAESIKNYLLFVGITILSIILLNLTVISGLSIKFMVSLLFFSVACAALFNVNATFSLLLVLLFSPYVIPVHQTVVFSVFVLLIVLLTHKGITKEEIKNPLLKYLIFYFIITLPSLINSSAIILSLRDMSNLFALFAIFISVLIVIKKPKQMLNIIYFFIGATFIHSIYVIYLGLTTGQRVFGLLGVYYIDYAGLGSLMTFILLLFTKGIKRNIAALAFLVITLGLILTQTRNAWLSTGFAIFVLIFYLFFNSQKLFIKKSVLSIISITFITAAILFSLNTGVNVNERLDSSYQKTVLTSDPESVGTNSFVSRALIWHTAFYAFLEHPVIGIGAYAFKHTSQNYYVIPKGFYKLFVVGRTPHVTYLQVLTETGLIGFLAFMIFIIVLIKYLLKTIKLLKEKEDIIITLLIVWSFVYIIFSMLMTESWLYGQYIVWLGILLGMLVNNRKHLETVKES